jgi:hypothetical protein
MAAERWLAAYPGWWRKRHGAEMTAILEDRPPDWRDRLDLLHGALDAHVRGAGGRPVVAPLAALVAGAAWTMAGAAVLSLPTPPDWPGHVLETLPLAFVGSATLLLAIIGLARRAWSSVTIGLEVALLVTVLAGIAWVATFASAVIGGPYGVITAAGQTAAALAAIWLGVAMQRAGAHPFGTIVVVTGGALLVSGPLAWLALGALWTAIGAWTVFVERSGTRPSGMAT